MRVSLNSARAALYERYYRPSGYAFADVCASIRAARSKGIWVSLNLLFFPGVTDTEEELDALARLVGENGVSMAFSPSVCVGPRFILQRGSTL
jgi:Pyruvate-formate lyase-activating enzyme